MEVQNCRLFLHRYLFSINALYNVLNSHKTLLLNCTWNNVPKLQYFNLAHQFTCTSLHQVSRNITGKASSTHNCCPQNLYNLLSYNSLVQVPFDLKLHSVGCFFFAMVQQTKYLSPAYSKYKNCKKITHSKLLLIFLTLQSKILMQINLFV